MGASEPTINCEASNKIGGDPAQNRTVSDMAIFRQPRPSCTYEPIRRKLALSEAT